MEFRGKIKTAKLTFDLDVKEGYINEKVYLNGRLIAENIYEYSKLSRV